MSIWAVVVAGGQGRRFGSSIPKQFALASGEFILAQSVRTLVRHPEVAGVVITTESVPQKPAEANARWQHLCETYADKLHFVAGGTQRIWSVKNGLDALFSVSHWSVKANDPVLVHDGARPCLHADDVTKLISTLKGFDSGARQGVMLGQPVTDSIKRVNQGVVVEEVDRTHLWQAQTPQGFAAGHLAEALERLQERSSIGLSTDALPTDESSLMRQLGFSVTCVEASHGNPKLTFARDRVLMDALLQDRISTNVQKQQETSMFRVGQGFDVHRFSDTPSSKGIMLGGVRVPSERDLIAHSDGDVVLHALCDALLGAAGLGDIGTHFSDTDAQYENQSSDWFVTQVMEKLTKGGFSVVNVDTTVIAQTPKVGPYRQQMNQTIAALVDISQELVNVKATTTEWLGFVGRSEGVAAQVSVLLKKQ